MPRSMTGFGRAGSRSGAETIEVEVRSVNGRHLALSARVPDALAVLEVEVDRAVRAAISRGSVNVAIRCVSPALVPAPRVDAARLAAWREALRRAGVQAGVDGELPLAALVTLPGVIQAGGGPVAVPPALVKRVSATLGKALAAHTKAREREGAALAADLLQRTALVTRCLEKIEARAPTVTAALHERLRRRVAELLGAPGAAAAQTEIAREVALLATKADVTEEGVRLRHHLADLRGSLKSRDAVGRKLDFLAQELLREFNTIGSKSADAEITSAVVIAKAEVDRIKEQAANLE